MPFDPTLPVNSTPIIAVELRNQFNALKALIDAQAAQITSLNLARIAQENEIAAHAAQLAALALMVTPVGGLAAWLKSLGGVPALGVNFVECNGQVLSDASSPLNGITLPNLNGASGGTPRFLRGASASGGEGGGEDHVHTMEEIDLDHGHTTAVNNSSGDINVVYPGSYNTGVTPTLPSYHEVVWVIRVR